MLISPPFLLARNANESDNDWIDRCMIGGQPGDGAFPVSFKLGWHGGMHLDAPMNGTQPEPVRAIADGEVVFLRQPTAQPAGPLPPTHPQAYNGWTDNGVVIIRHTTEIGEGANAAVTFFSITMHLSEIDPAVRQGRAVYRKARLGTAGQIYGNTQRQIHLEIVCDDDNLARFVGRASGDLPHTADGRVDAVYGEMYFHLPMGTPVYGQQPLPNDPQAMMQPPGQPAPPPQAQQPVHTTTEEFIVGLRYAGGDGAAGARGDAFLMTYRPDGTTLGAALQENDAEYDLYTSARAICNTYPATGRPAPSAVYELLRFGRAIGPDALNPATVPHWRKVRYPGGQGWVNLNAANVHKFSDADFPHWKQWRLIDDAVGQDSRCDSAVIRGWLDANNDGQIVPSEAQTRLADATIAPKLARAICKFPTEWDSGTVDTRWGWLKTSTPENPQPLSDSDFELLRAHITALAFWPGGMGIDANHWHWQPSEFVRQFRTCTWVAASELAQTLPRRRPAVMNWVDAQRRARDKAQALNVLVRKYVGSNKQRLAHLLAQVFIETDLLNTFAEYSQGNGYPYGAFYGRGLMQLTWPKNYAAYGAFRDLPNHAGPYADPRITSTSTHTWEAQGANLRWAPRFDPQLASTNDFAAGDSGGFYWVSKTFRGTRNINRVCDIGAEARLVGYASWLVNGGGNGYRERQLYFAYAINEVMDEPRLTGTHGWSFPVLGQALTGTFPPGNPPNASTVQVNYERQIP